MLNLFKKDFGGEDLKDIEPIYADSEVKSVDEEARTLEGTASTEAKDRVGDIIRQDGWELGRFRKNPVFLFAHNYRMPPIGKVVKISTKNGKMDFKVQFPEERVYPLADLIFNLYKDKTLNGFSVGFISKEWKEIKEKDRKKDKVDPDVQVRRTWSNREILKAELLEISSVPIGCNFEALQKSPDLAQMVYKTVTDANDQYNSMLVFEGDTRKMMEEFMQEVKGCMDTDNKTVIGYKKYPLAPEGTAWDGPAQIRAAEVKDLKVTCTWYDAEKPDIKGSYKLPHHQSKGYKTVWRGVANSMAVLFGARGGVNVPSGDRKGIYNHLAKHYGDFDKKPPAFKDYEEEEIKVLDRVIDGDITREDTDKHSEMLDEWRETIKTYYDFVYPEEEKQQTVEIEVEGFEQLAHIVEMIKTGRVISEKNRKLINATITSLEQTINSLKGLLNATEGDNPKPGKGGEPDNKMTFEELLEDLKKHYSDRRIES